MKCSVSDCKTGKSAVRTITLAGTDYPQCEECAARYDASMAKYRRNRRDAGMRSAARQARTNNRY